MVSIDDLIRFPAGSVDLVILRGARLRALGELVGLLMDVEDDLDPEEFDRLRAAYRAAHADYVAALDRVAGGGTRDEWGR